MGVVAIRDGDEDASDRNERLVTVGATGVRHCNGVTKGYHASFLALAESEARLSLVHLLLL